MGELPLLPSQLPPSPPGPLSLSESQVGGRRKVGKCSKNLVLFTAAGELSCTTKMISFPQSCRAYNSASSLLLWPLSFGGAGLWRGGALAGAGLW